VWFLVFVTVFGLLVGLLLCCGWIRLLYCLCRCLWVEVFSVCSSTSKGKLFSRSVFCGIASVSVVRVLFRSGCSDEGFASSVDLLCTPISPSTMKRAFVVCTRSLIRLSLASRSAICCYICGAWMHCACFVLVLRGTHPSRPRGIHKTSTR
jgi:hypothetical protein